MVYHGNRGFPGLHSIFLEHVLPVMEFILPSALISMNFSEAKDMKWSMWFLKHDFLKKTEK